MVKLLSLIILSCLLTGCSLLPRLTFDRPGVTPTKTEKSVKNERCAGEFTVDKETGAISCTKGYYFNSNNYKNEERKYTLQERIANFIRGMVGWGFWLLVLALLLVPGLAGWLLGRVFNVFRSALEGTVKAIGNFKSKIPTVQVNGVDVPDPNYVKAVDTLLDELENQHSKDKEVLKTISDIRLKLKIEDND
jgi:hypothetical protein